MLEQMAAGELTLAPLQGAPGCPGADCAPEKGCMGVSKAHVDLTLAGPWSASSPVSVPYSQCLK